MTLAELNESLPNGFHDAEITKLVWDFADESAFFDISILIGVPEADDREERRSGTLELKRILFIAIDPPYPRELDPKPYRPCGAFQIDAVPADEKIFEALPSLKSELPPDTEIFSFYVVNSNSFIHIAAQEVKLIWKDSE